MPKVKKTLKVSTEWSNILRQSEHAIKEQSGEIYRVESVDLETFLSSPDYLNQGMWGLSDAQKEFVDNATDFENGKNFFVMMVG